MELMFNFVWADFTEIENYILDQDFALIFWSDDVESIWMDLRKVINEVYVQFVPPYSTNKRNYPHWFTHEIRHLINCAQTARRREKQCPSPAVLFRLD